MKIATSLRTIGLQFSLLYFRALNDCNFQQYPNVFSVLNSNRLVSVHEGGDSSLTEFKPCATRQNAIVKIIIIIRIIILRKALADSLVSQSVTMHKHSFVLCRLEISVVRTLDSTRTTLLDLCTDIYPEFRTNRRQKSRAQIA